MISFDFMYLFDSTNQVINWDKIALYAAPIITLLGWGFTYLFQRKILIQNRNYQKSDRDLTNFRERLSIIRGIISANFETTKGLTKLNFLFLSGDFSFDEGTKIVEELNTQGTNLINLMYDPGFRSIQKLLPLQSSNQIYELIKHIYSRLSEIHLKAAKIDEFTPNLQNELETLSLQISELIPKIIDFSEFLSQEYSKQDILLSKA